VTVAQASVHSIPFEQSARTSGVMVRWGQVLALESFTSLIGP
jgi:hypothetical protein